MDGKAGVLLKETNFYITLVTTPGVHSLVSPKAARSLIYDASTKVGQCSEIVSKVLWRVPRFAGKFPALLARSHTRSLHGTRAAHAPPTPGLTGS